MAQKNIHNLVEVKKGQLGKGLLIENDGYISLDVKGNESLNEAIRLNEGESITKSLPRPFVVSAVFQKFGIENANGRIYPEDILKREVEKYQTKIRNKEAYGEENHPESSSIDLGRLAMNIIELHWEGHTLVGKMEIPITDGFRNYGIVSTCFDQIAHIILSGLRIGVSSRALGSVSQVMDKLIVGEDLEIICWDVVANPSTPMAYIETSEDKLQPYIESTKKKGSLISESDSSKKLDKFKEWLNI